MATEAQNSDQDEKEDKTHAEATDFHNKTKITEEIQQTLDAGVLGNASVYICEQIVEVELGLHLAPTWTVEYWFQKNYLVGCMVGIIVPLDTVFGIDWQIRIIFGIVDEIHVLKDSLFFICIFVPWIEIAFTAFAEGLISPLNCFTDGVRSRRRLVTFLPEIGRIFDHESSQHDKHNKVEQHGDRIKDHKLILLSNQAYNYERKRYHRYPKATIESSSPKEP